MEKFRSKLYFIVFQVEKMHLILFNDEGCFAQTNVTKNVFEHTKLLRFSLKPSKLLDYTVEKREKNITCTAIFA